MLSRCKTLQVHCSLVPPDEALDDANTAQVDWTVPNGLRLPIEAQLPKPFLEDSRSKSKEVKLGFASEPQRWLSHMFGRVDSQLSDDSQKNLHDLGFNMIRNLQELPSIADIVFSRVDLFSFAAAFDFADLTSTLDGPGPLTVFAANNDAVLSDEVTQILRNEEFMPHVVDFLLYQLVGELIFASNVTNTRNYAALNGENVTLSTGPFAVNGVPVLETDVIASNGILQIIDELLLPSWVFNSIASRVVNDADLSTLFTFLEQTALTEALNTTSELTLLAPVNNAFAALPADVIDFLVNEPGLLTLTFVLSYHVLLGVYTSSEFVAGGVPTLATRTFVTIGIDPITFNADGGNPGGLVEGDILANNGVVHKINAVLNPGDSIAPPTSAPSDAISNIPSIIPSDVPSNVLSDVPSNVVSDVPSDISSDLPSDAST
jgi:transforming growth factor-beta-induced protein